MDKKIIITIGRQFGSGGKCVADILGRKLGIPVYDNELITKAAQESGFSKELFADRDEKKRLFSLSTLFSSGYEAENGDIMSDNGLFKIQSETIRKIARQGSAIIVGRCSDYILRDRKDTINVFLTSPVEIRAERVAERMGIDMQQAMELIEKKDKSRCEYYNYYTFGEWGVASTYDLCINSGMIGIEETAGLILEFARKAGKL